MYITNCIERILVQSHQMFEIICVNDGSTDSTLLILQEYSKTDCRIKVFSQDNKGVSSARNKGISEASNEILVFIDADDTIKKDYLFQLLIGFNGKNTVICGTINIKDGVSVNKKSYQELVRKCCNLDCSVSLIDLLQYQTLGSPCARLYCKSVIIENNILFDEKISYQEDLIFNLHYYKSLPQIKVIDYFGYQYIERKNSSSGKFHKNFNHLEALCGQLTVICKSESDEEIVNEFMLQSSLKKIANIFHKDSDQSEVVKLNEIQQLFTSTYFRNAAKVIDSIGINKLLKVVLKSKNKIFLFYYFKIFQR